MSEKKIDVPEGMLKAAIDVYWNCKAKITAQEFPKYILEAALRWLSENPIVPTKEQADQLWHHPKTLSGDEHYAKAMARQWQQIMFLAPEPEVPEEVEDLLSSRPEASIPACRYNEVILEAFRRGQRAGSTR